MRDGFPVRAIVCTSLAVLVGCGGVPPPGPFSPEVTWVIDHRADFELQPEGTRLNVAAGTVIDPLTELTGCWAWSSESTSANWQVSVYRFDEATGEYGTWDIAAGAFNDPAPRVISNEGGTFRIADPARLELAGRGASINLLTGMLEYIDLPPRLVYVTLAGDELVVHDTLPAEGPQNEPVYRPFVCPG